VTRCGTWTLALRDRVRTILCGSGSTPHWLVGQSNSFIDVVAIADIVPSSEGITISSYGLRLAPIFQHPSSRTINSVAKQQQRLKDIAASPLTTCRSFSNQSRSQQTEASTVRCPEAKPPGHYVLYKKSGLPSRIWLNFRPSFRGAIDTWEMGHQNERLFWRTMPPLDRQTGTLLLQRYFLRLRTWLSMPSSQGQRPASSVEPSPSLFTVRPHRPFARRRDPRFIRRLKENPAKEKRPKITKAKEVECYSTKGPGEATCLLWFSPIYPSISSRTASLLPQFLPLSSYSEWRIRCCQ